MGLWSVGLLRNDLGKLVLLVVGVLSQFRVCLEADKWLREHVFCCSRSRSFIYLFMLSVFVR